MKFVNSLIICLLVFSCQKAEDRSCFKMSGSYEERTFSLEAFNRLNLKEHLTCKLIQDSTNKIVIKGGKNLLNFVESTVSDGLLSLHNKNKCNYLRGYDFPTVEVHYTQLINILFEGTEPLYNEDTLFTDYLTLTLRDGAGEVDLRVAALDINAVNTHGWGSLKLKGHTQGFRGHLMGDGSFDVRGLKVSNELKIISSSSRAQYIKAQGIPLYSEIQGIGNIYYFGVPSVIHKLRYGQGDLIDLN